MGYLVSDVSLSEQAWRHWSLLHDLGSSSFTYLKNVTRVSCTIWLRCRVCVSVTSLFVVALEFDGGAAVVAGAVCLESARAGVTAAGAAAQLLRSASAQL